MTALPGDARDRLAAALADGHAAYYADPRMVDLKACQLDALLPVVAELADQAAAGAITDLCDDLDHGPLYAEATRYFADRDIDADGLDVARVIRAALAPTTEGTSR